MMLKRLECISNATRSGEKIHSNYFYQYEKLHDFLINDRQHIWLIYCSTHSYSKTPYSTWNQLKQVLSYFGVKFAFLNCNSAYT